MTTRTLKLLLVGGGHGHLYVLKQLQVVGLPNVETTLLSPSRFQYYSGMFSGYAEDIYTLDEVRIDLVSLAHKANVNLFEDHAQYIDIVEKLLFTGNGRQLPFDIISFDIGSLAARSDIPGVHEFSHTIKPNYQLPKIIERVRNCNRLVVIGGGAAGVEMSLSVQSWRKQHQIHHPVQLVTAGGLLKRERSSISKKIESITRAKGVDMHLHEPVLEVHDGRMITSNEFIPFDEALWLTGPSPSPLFRRSALFVDRHGYMLVKDTLQATNNPNVFGVGDCATMESYPELEKSGVYAVRQAPILWTNLKNYIEEKSLDSYHPQRNILSILSTGDKQALLMYRGTSFHGRFAWNVKHRIDKRFVNQYQ